VGAGHSGINLVERSGDGKATRRSPQYFHFGTFTITETSNAMKERQSPIRLDKSSVYGTSSEKVGQ